MSFLFCFRWCMFIYTNVHPLCQQIQAKAIMNENQATRLGFLVSKLEQTKHCLQKAGEETQMMTHCIASMKEELEKTKMELIELKSLPSMKRVLNEDLKFIENA